MDSFQARHWPLILCGLIAVSQSAAGTGNALEAIEQRSANEPSPASRENPQGSPPYAREFAPGYMGRAAWAALAQWIRTGDIVEDPGRYALRQAVRDAADRLAGKPCDAEARAALIAASRAFNDEMEASNGRQNDRSEVTTVDGVRLTASPIFDGPVRSIQVEALRDRVGSVSEILGGDLGPGDNFRAVGKGTGRFACLDGNRPPDTEAPPVGDQRQQPVDR